MLIYFLFEASDDSSSSSPSVSTILENITFQNLPNLTLISYFVGPNLSAHSISNESIEIGSKVTS